MSRDINFDSRRSFATHLYASFKATYGPFLTFASIALAVIVYFVVPSTFVIAGKYFIIVGLLGLYVFWLLLHAAYTAFSFRSISLPRVLYGQSPPDLFSSSVALLVMDSSSLFSYGSMVSIYFIENEIERFVGVGRVVNIQEDKKIQVLVMHNVEFTDGWEAIRGNNATKLKNLIVKPTVTELAAEFLKKAQYKIESE
ncbi:MAG: hypothetical protein ACFFCW_40085 [Candidatus Hodarchaeota archaeon]